MATNPDPDQPLSTIEWANRLGKSRGRIAAWIADGVKVKGQVVYLEIAHHDGGPYRITPREMERFHRRCREARGIPATPVRGAAEQVAHGKRDQAIAAALLG